MPALQYAAKVQKKAATIGFDWQEVSPIFDKVREELSEVEEAQPEGRARLEEELGDLLFSVVNLARKLKVDPEVALSGATHKFARRFRGVEARMRERGIPSEGTSLEALDMLWDEVKNAEKSEAASKKEVP
jgi:MazG family protein